jgi:hypothetical protein
LVISLNIDDREVGVEVRRDGEWIEISCRGNMGILWKEEFYATDIKELYRFDFSESQLINARGDFIAKKLRISSQVTNVIAPDFDGNYEAGIVVHRL